MMRRPRSPRPAVMAAVVAVGLLAAGCSGSGTTPAASGTAATPPPPACTGVGEPCPLRALAERREAYVGAAVNADRLTGDERYAATVAREFNSITAENEMKWTELQAARGAWDFAAADTLVAFAQDHKIAVRGHTLIWGQSVGNGIPPWVRDITDPAELDAVVTDHITTVVGRYRGRVNRWDVVNEPLQSLGTDLDQNHFHQVLGPTYIAKAFRLAHEVDPDARLYLNEHSIEHHRGKADALVALVDQLLADGVPIHGVGIQAHQFAGAAPAPGELARLVTAFRQRGLDVAITELDVPLTDSTDRAGQAAAYRQIVSECFDAGCTEVTVWGVDDAHTWLDNFLKRTDTNPLLFDDDVRPKPAYDAVNEALRRR